MVLGGVGRDSTTDARSEDAKEPMGLGRYIVALALFRCFGRPFALDWRQRAHKNPSQAVSSGVVLSRLGLPPNSRSQPGRFQGKACLIDIQSDDYEMVALSDVPRAQSLRSSARSISATPS